MVSPNRMWVHCLAAAAIMAASAGAQTVIDLPDLPGTYEVGLFPPDSGPPERLTSFEFPADVLNVDAITFVISGELQEGLLICADPVTGEPDTSSYVPGLSLWFWDGDPGTYMRATVAAPAGAFTAVEAAMTSCCPPGAWDPDTLPGRVLQAEFFLDFAVPLTCSSDGVDARLQLTDAHIEVTGAVPDERSSWSAVKALYH